MVQRAQVSSLGRFRSTTGVVSRPPPTHSGYVQVKIHKKAYKLHRLIALAFELPRHEGQTTLNHKDEDLSNDMLSNLEWVSPSEQTKQSYATNAGRKSNVAKRAKPVRGRRVGESAWTDFASVREAARVHGLPQGHVSACCWHKIKQTGGFEFKFGSPTEPERLDGEEWRSVEGTTAAVSSLGRFRSTMGVVSTPSSRPNGYVQVRINRKLHPVHRLIAIAFQLPRNEGQNTVDHIDNDPSNNALSNLRWVSQRERVCYSYTTNAGRRLSATQKPVRGRRVGESAWMEYASSNEAARVLGSNVSNVSACCWGKQKQTGGFEFEFASPIEPERLDGEEWRDVPEHVLDDAVEN